MRFANTEITPETITRTREHFANLYRQCIADAQSGTTRVNCLTSYVARRQDAIDRTLAGETDHTFTFLQRAHWLQTGQCLPLFARAMA